MTRTAKLAVDDTRSGHRAYRRTTCPLPGIFSNAARLVFVLSLIVVTFGACGTNDPVEVINRAPTSPTNPSPADSATGQAITGTLSWQCSDPEGKTLSYDLYFGITSPPDSLAVGLTQNSYAMPALEYATTYYWNVVARDNEGLKTSGKIWRFTTVANGAPVAPHTPSPAHMATDLPVNLTLSWTSSDPELDALTYDVYLGKLTNPGLVASDLTLSSYTPSPLDYGSTYYWRVKAKDGSNETLGQEWRFDTAVNQAPTKPYNPSPADGEGDRPLQNTLSWQATDNEADPLTFDVYFGESANPPSIATNHPSKTYTLGQLEYGRTYYWKIVARDNHGNQTVGDIWSFRTLGGVWSPVTTPISASWRGIWGTSGSDIHVVGSVGAIIHYNGSAWSSVGGQTSNYMNDVWGLSPTSAFAVGERGTILYWNGSAWTTMTNPVPSTIHLQGVWGTALNNVYAVGTEGTIVHYNGSQWSTVVSGTTEALLEIFGFGASSIYVPGDDGTLLRFNGSSWVSENTGVTNPLYCAWGLSEDDFYIGGWRTLIYNDGTGWSPAMSTFNDFRGIWGSASNDVFAAGIVGVIYHFDGTTWRPMDSGTTEHFYGGVWGTSYTNVYAVGDDNTVLHFGPP